MSYNFSQKIGLGTWRMGESEHSKRDEIKAIEHAVSIGYRLIDTAEMYANGNSEKLMGLALKNLGGSTRDQLTIVSKVLPSNASTTGVVKACEASLKRLGCEYLDLYLLHWKGSHSFEATLEGFQLLKQRGLIKHHGVSNFDLADIRQWTEVEKSMGIQSEGSLATNQVYYALSARGVEFDLIPFLGQTGIALMAYSPLGGGDLARHKKLHELAASLGITGAQLALAWVIRQPNIVAIPKSVSKSKIEENWLSQGIVLNADTVNALDLLFSPPKKKTSLAIL